MIDVFKFEHEQNIGPNLLVFGAVHGWETCGTEAIQHWIKRFESGDVALQKGSITFVPVCNPHAQEQGVRATDADLNRSYVKKDPATTDKYEEKIAQHLMPLIDVCDYFLDIHSFNNPSKPFVFQDSDKDDFKKFAACLGVEDIVIGWNDYFPPAASDFSSGLSYAIKQGKIGAVIECGQHQDPQSIDVAKKAISNTLSHLELIDEGAACCDGSVKQHRLFFHHNRPENSDFHKAFTGFDPVKIGETIAVCDGDPLLAPKNSAILLPDPDSDVGGEWFYLVEDVTQ